MGVIANKIAIDKLSKKADSTTIFFDTSSLFVEGAEGIRIAMLEAGATLTLFVRVDDVSTYLFYDKTLSNPVDVSFVVENWSTCLISADITYADTETTLIKPLTVTPHVNTNTVTITFILPIG